MVQETLKLRSATASAPEEMMFVTVGVTLYEGAVQDFIAAVEIPRGVIIEVVVRDQVGVGL